MAHTHSSVDIKERIAQLEQPARETRAVSRRNMHSTDKWETNLTSMGVAGKHQPCGRALCQFLERLGSMCEYQRECGVGDSLETGIQIGMPKVRVVSTDKPYAVAASTQDL